MRGIKKKKKQKEGKIETVDLTTQGFWQAGEEKCKFPDIVNTISFSLFLLFKSNHLPPSTKLLLCYSPHKMPTQTCSQDNGKLVV